MGRLLKLPMEVLTTIAESFQASNDDPRPTGSKALAIWHDAIRVLAGRLYAASIAAHCLLGFRRWRFDDLNAGSDLTAAPSTIEFAQLSRATLAGAGVDTTREGAHSMRRVRVAGLSHGGGPRAAVSETLRHRDPRSLAPYEPVTATQRSR